MNTKIFALFIGIIKNVTTFVFLISYSGRKPLLLSGIFCALFILLIPVKRCRNYRDCLNTIPLYEVRNGKYDTVLCCASKNLNSTMQTNQTIALPSLDEQAKLPEALHGAAVNFFDQIGNPAIIDEMLLTMLEAATAGVEEVGLGTKDVLSYLSFYRATKTLFVHLHSFTAQTNVELCTN